MFVARVVLSLVLLTSSMSATRFSGGSPARAAAAAKTLWFANTAWWVDADGFLHLKIAHAGAA